MAWLGFAGTAFPGVVLGWLAPDLPDLAGTGLLVWPEPAGPEPTLPVPGAPACRPATLPPEFGLPVTIARTPR
jgi:hypothetical protein